MAKERLDTLMRQRGLAEDRDRAKRLIMAGAVTVNGQPATKAGHRYDAAAEIALKARPRFVGRGGEKLQAALDAFGIDPRGAVCVDIGASTGGFTDCLLQNGAARVYAVDVGRGQLDWSLRKDARVVVMERVNARYLQPDDWPERPVLATVDASFISLTKILPAVTLLLGGMGRCVALIKPQFEARREDVGAGGVVRDAAVHAAVIGKVEAFATNELNVRWEGVIPSPLKGPAGNIEFLAVMSKMASAGRAGAGA